MRGISHLEGYSLSLLFHKIEKQAKKQTCKAETAKEKTVIRKYTATHDSLRRRITHGSSIVCNTCGQDIIVGDAVVTKTGARLGKFIRHEQCARRIGLVD